MYCGNVTRVFVYSQRNCFLQKRGKHFIGNGTIQTKHPNRFTVFCSFLRNITPAIKFNNVSRGWRSISTQYSAFRLLKYELLKIPSCLKRHSVHIVRTCTQQCECVVAHRIRRGQQIFSLYTRLWDESALKELVGRMRQQLARRGKLMLLSAVGVVGSNGDNITEEEMRRYIDDFDFIASLRDNTMTCTDCHQRQIIDVEVPNILYCTCPGSESITPKDSTVDWIPFIQRKELEVWRKEEKDGLYAYKVYGRYDDVTAADFLKVQLDIEYRKEWDPMAVKLEVIQSDPSTFSDTIYWEMEWPRLFANRDYVFNRRYLVDHEQQVIVLVSKCTTHPSYPPSKSVHRVTDYYSFMVIKPIENFTEPGIEFSLTYFDNPGISLPTALSSWAAKSALPDFLARIRVAALAMAKRRDQNEDDDSVGIMPVFGLVKDKLLGSTKKDLLDDDVVLNEDDLIDETESIPERIREPEAGQDSPPGEDEFSDPPGNTQIPESDKKPSPLVPSDVMGKTPEDDSPEPEMDRPSGENGEHSDSPEHSEDECSSSDSKSKEEQTKSSIYFSSFPYQDPPDVSYFQFHTANLFT